MSELVPDCDAPDGPVYVMGYRDGEVVYGCRCIICSRCGHHTGNGTQGHYWSYCQVTGQREGFHMCCPRNCEIHGSAS